MSEQFLAEIRIVSFNFAPRGWAFCNGQLLPINQNQALFALLGTTFGGNGQTNFALPNFQGRIPMHVGNGYSLGQIGGAENHILTVNEIPAHTHLLYANPNTAIATEPGSQILGKTTDSIYNATPNTSMASSSTTTAGSNQAHNNTQPSLVLNVIIALEGIFPSRN